MTHLWKTNSHEPSGKEMTCFCSLLLPHEAEEHSYIAQNRLSWKADEKQKPVEGDRFAWVTFRMDRQHGYKYLYLFRFTSVVTEG